MNRRIRRVLLLGLSLHFSLAVAFAQPRVSYVPNEVLFKVEQPFISINLSGNKIITEQAWFNDLAAQFQIVALEPIFGRDHPALRGWYKAKFQTPSEVPMVVSVFQQQSTVLRAEPNGLVNFFSSSPNDTHYPSQWNLPHIRMPEAWDIASGSNQVIIAVIDDGVKTTQEDLVTQLWVNPNETVNGNDDDGNGYVDDIYGIYTETWSTGQTQTLFQADLTHGTRVASVCCARTNNAKGIAGVAGGGFAGQQGAKLMVIRVPVSDEPSTSDVSSIARGIDYATVKGAHVVNMSLGFRPTIQNNYDLGPIASAILVGAETGRSGLGVIYTAGSGNVDSPRWPQFGDDVFPAAFAEVLAVGSIGQDGLWYYTSNYNVDWLDVVAPGENIWVATATTDNTYGEDTGTSFAAPHAAGLAALILSLNPNLYNDQVHSIVKSTATDIGDPTRTGRGVINPYQALLLTHAYSNKSMSSTATASNNGRRLVKTSDGKYHLVFESGVTSGGNVLSEIFYRNSTDGVNWSPPVRLSAGNEQNRYPSIAERSGKLYVVWQRKAGTDIYQIHFRYFNGSSWETVRNVTNSIGSNSDPLPVIAVSTPAAAFEMMVAYRITDALKSQRTTSANGSSWGSPVLVTSTSNANNPSLVYKSNSSPGYFVLSWDNGSNIYHQSYNGSSWSTPAYRLTAPACRLAATNTLLTRYQAISTDISFGKPTTWTFIRSMSFAMPAICARIHNCLCKLRLRFHR